MEAKMYWTAYSTSKGKQIIGDSLEVLKDYSDNSINLVLTSPPFALEGRKKTYGNFVGQEYIDWLCQFAQIVFDKLTEDGSFVLDLGAVYNKGIPTYSLYQFKVLIKLCEEIGFSLAQPFYWYNPSSLPSPIEWVNKRKLRAKNAVNTIWWLSKTDHPKANISKVLVPYSTRMQSLMNNPKAFVKEEGVIRPSGHVMGQSSWTHDNGGAIPPNILKIPNSESNSQYLRYCKQMEIKGHPARFPVGIPDFFIRFLTDENDLIVDIFSGSNTTGFVAEQLNRKWVSIELSKEYASASSFRFAKDLETAKTAYDTIMNEGSIVL